MTLAFSKVILLGEHAVVYGHPAVAGALSAGVEVTAEPRTAGPSTLAIPAWGARVTSDDDTPLAAALRELIDATNSDRVALTADARVPPGAGLGSSAALSVAICRVLAPDRDLHAIETLANRAEQHFHANPSGVDVALAARGGIGVFRRGAGFEPIATAPLRAAIGLSGEPRSTADMVRHVATVADARAHDLEALGTAALAGATALARGDTDALGPLFDDAHGRLAKLGVSTPRLDQLVATAKAAGAVGAKLTGAGGGGAVIAIGSERAVVDAWTEAGFDAFECYVGAS